ncbi:hypothetical protein EYM_01735 [Ignicoccus islandicus DSM 13165]|uniref:Uncharacterized protein n=1 Tax=Ignicoccus islandicus DSM 13165 TaxID=940295 RepID=A0A0U3EAA2_9CREN|nr:hypothetical protein [Ignicoccus islandicus]ALU12238.1 hypothetical protein EYM_01735 [Ignicoccus islandicus DSM 13165]
MFSEMETSIEELKVSMGKLSAQLETNNKLLEKFIEVVAKR